MTAALHNVMGTRRTVLPTSRLSPEVTMSSPAPRTSRAFTAYAWIFLVYMLAVILFGAWVRITGSGAGCGSHWPTCHGEIIPPSPSVQTMIEYTHRLTSGFLGILGIILVGWSWRLFKSHPAFWASVVTFIFILFEGAIGAGLVLAELVADDDSVARAVVIAIHLVNTLILSGATAFTAWLSTGRTLPRLRSGGVFRGLLLVGMLGLIATSMSGAVTALGDTLFPVDPTVGSGLLDRVRDDLSAANHFLVRLRIFHPVIAVGTAAYLLVVGWIVKLREPSPSSVTWANVVIALVIGQTMVGVFNILLSAPGWVQLLHLLVAQVLWIATLFLASTLMQPDDTSAISR
ncbi:heme A synthase [Lujinxingia vulgaris]|uniref:Heme A synthase n=2 Tax=Lujinxingia vulgaris TaxID=2600176 RepID=A0A5C6XQ24_9DELT|nr:heme A synthase [Lujinxingia vulgaris]